VDKTTVTHKNFAAERASVECLCHERGKAKTPARGQRYEQQSEGSVYSSALCGVRLCRIGGRGFLLGGDAGDRFGVEAEVRVWRRLGLVDINEHRLGVVRRSVESEMLRAYVVIKEPRLIAVFRRARVRILHVGLLGAGFDRASFSRQRKRETNGAGRRSATSAPASASVRSSRLCDPSYWLVNGDEIRKDCLHTERFERKWIRTNQRLKRAMGEAPCRAG
jgi:hypothetical protein